MLKILRHTLSIIALPFMVVIVIPIWLFNSFVAYDTRWVGMTSTTWTGMITGGLFVVETLSVIIQVASFKLTGKRVFRMAPLHHHFELKGWPEPRVIVRFWIITIMLVLFGLATLKLR